MRSHTTALLAVIVLVTLIGCASSTPVRHPQGRGFLTDYDRLSKGKKHQAELVYVAKDVDWKKYEAILLDPVGLWRGTEARSRGLSHSQAQTLANYFHQALYNELSKYWRMTDVPGPDTLRISAAITKLDEERVVLDVVSTVVPEARALDTLQTLATGTPAFTGRAAIEARMTDTENGELVAEGIDERVGRHILSGKQLRRWGDVQDIIEFWIQRSVHNLCTVQERKDCPPLPHGG